MRLLKESVLQIWKARKTAVSEGIASAERAAKALQEKLSRLDEAFVFERSIDIDAYDRHAKNCARSSLSPGSTARSTARRRPVGTGVARAAPAIQQLLLAAG